MAVRALGYDFSPLEKGAAPLFRFGCSIDQVTDYSERRANH
jgi:hypothetical protein